MTDDRPPHHPHQTAHPSHQSYPTQPSPRDSKSDLLEAAREAIHDQQEKARDFRLQPNEGTSRTWVGFFGLVSLVGLSLLLTRPEWLVGPDRPPPETPAVASASIRLALLRERQRVVDFRKQKGRLPSTMQEVGSGVEGITLHATADSEFELSAFAGDSLITLGSRDSMVAFLGSAFRTLKQRGVR